MAKRDLPSLESLIDYRPKIPLQIFSAEGELIGEFGDERRAMVKIQDVPKHLKDAIIAAEDERFYEHGGIDYVGVARALVANLTPGGGRQGASTITMQVARNFLLSSEQTYSRKFKEALLAFEIESKLTKDEILQLYVNQIYLGQRAYGFAVAAQTYFGKPLDRLSLSEFAMLAALPKFPSAANPVTNPSRAKVRQEWVLGRMKTLGYITQSEYDDAVKTPIQVRREKQTVSTRADYLTEMVRQAVYDRYQDEAYSRGFRVFTTVRRKHQEAARLALRKGVLDYERRQGYRGAESFTELRAGITKEELDEKLINETESDDVLPAYVLSATDKSIQLYAKGAGIVDVTGDALKYVKPMLGDKAPADKRLRRGALTRVQKNDKGVWQIVQLPQVEAAFVSIDPLTGACLALVGGFDFNRNKFNHVTQAYRQPGSSFKPFVYSAALEKGFTPATIINDAPLSFDASETGSEAWEPKNYDKTFEGPMRMRTALTKSKNMVSIRILQAIGTRYAQDYVVRFGFDPKLVPPYLTMALGAGSVTAWQLAGGYSVFANGGYRVQPYFIDRIEDSNGNVIAATTPQTAPETAPRVIDARNAFIMTNVMQDVINAGTGARARQLGRSDLAGKTGTTNDQLDAWFAGFNGRLVAVAWMGYDAPRSLGEKETGAAAALPIWISYMGAVLKGVPAMTLPVPDGVVAASVNPDSGLRDTCKGGKIVEYFYRENVPPEEPCAIQEEGQSSGTKDTIEDQIY